MPPYCWKSFALLPFLWEIQNTSFPSGSSIWKSDLGTPGVDSIAATRSVRLPIFTRIKGTVSLSYTA